ncbi:hypothetical protein J19TS1_22510 [Heyndrickxia oleronia]|nr:hypothetical protein J19TS1_22510 [Heyndrickxia oleronia]
MSSASTFEQAAIKNPDMININLKKIMDFALLLFFVINTPPLKGNTFGMQLRFGLGRFSLTLDSSF